MAGREGKRERERERKMSKRGRTLKRIVRKLLDCVVPLLWLCFNSSPTHILLLLLLCTYDELACVNLNLFFFLNILCQR